MSPDPEEIQHESVDREKPLRVRDGFEPAHLSLGYCQVDEKLVDRPPRYWAQARREPAMLGIRNGLQPQLDNTLKMNKTVVDYGNPPWMSSAALRFGFHRGAHTGRGRPETARVVSTIMIRNRLLRAHGNTAAITCPAGRSRP